MSVRTNGGSTQTKRLVHLVELTEVLVQIGQR